MLRHALAVRGRTPVAVRRAQRRTLCCTTASSSVRRSGAAAGTASFEHRVNAAAMRRALVRHMAHVAKAASRQAGRTMDVRLLLGVGGVGMACAGARAYRSWHQAAEVDGDDDVELPLVPEPQGHFVHPYEEWPWYRRAWFTVKRSAFLAWVFAPFMCVSVLVVVFKDNKPLREIWLDKMLQCTQRAGAAFQKFGQWLSMRPDMFPPDVIEVLSKLRSDAPSHSKEVSRQTLHDQFGRDVDELFEVFEDVPVASGSVGQVHRARLRSDYALDGPGGKLRDVAVKIRHPGVADSAFMDLSILWKTVDFSERFLHMTMPFNRGEFDEVIQAQMDFTREAHNLQRFSRNFKGEKRIRFPKVSPKFVTPQVLIETWADGKVVSNILEDFDNAKSTCSDKLSAFTAQKREVQGRLCKILYDMSMKMMVRDNFVHGDLHGGNILYSEADNHVTVLDAGIATSLEPTTFAPFGRFLHALCSGHTDTIVQYLDKFNESSYKVDLQEFKQDIQRIMDKFMPETPVNAADMFGEVMFSMQKHRMLLKGDVASTLFTISISEGLIRQLDPSFDVAKSAIPYIISYMSEILPSLASDSAAATR